MKVKSIVVLLGGCMMACRPVEISEYRQMNRRVTVNEADRTIRAEVQQGGKVRRAGSGRMYYWFDSGRIGLLQGAGNGKLLDGEYREYDRRLHQPLVSGTFRHGLRQGTWLSWETQGRLEKKQHYHRGLLQGISIRYDSLGRPADTLRYRRGRLLPKKIPNDSTGVVAKIKGLLSRKKK